ncbi:MAG: ATP-grasp domain-containing protein [Sandaracinaceae bacterium]|nr:ATP-grasp domain-containing protein [Sandaracinaceae bacterium]
MSTTRIQKILIANRGEIARRIIRTCKRLGIASVAVFSDADESMPFVREADEAVRIGPAPSAESYLRADKILEAAKRTGADAIHPGYGFLSENTAFAQACADAGVIFIGPTAAAIASMGSKREAKRLVGAAGVPVIPGYDGADQDPAVLAQKALEVGFPVLLKASAGGGGKGMKLVRAESELADAIASARREGENSFGDGTLLVERYVERPRHVEIQILGDAHGRLLHLHERECSIQRRHQKIIEESPSPALTPELRAKMGAAAVLCGQAIGYTNAGTVEFILSPEGEFFFLEVNTRLQVEHPVTECITGLDLVEQQIRVAEGRALTFGQDEVPLMGHALEVRIYAEDPAGGFLPQSGPVLDWYLPAMEGLRVDGGVESGDVVGIHYDPMMAKIITHGADREQSVRRMQRALSMLSVQGLATNRDFLLQLLAHPAFLSGDLHTHFIDQHFPDGITTDASAAQLEEAALVAALAAQAAREGARAVVPGVPSGFRNNRFAPEWAAFEPPSGDSLRVEYVHAGAGRFEVTLPSGSRQVTRIAAETSGRAITLRLEVDGLRRSYRVVLADERCFVQWAEASVELREQPRFPDLAAQVPKGGCVAPMPGKIIEVRVQAGDRVAAGQTLLVMEAMKMEHAVTASADGVVAELYVAASEQVEADTLLALVTPDDDAA